MEYSYSYREWKTEHKENCSVCGDFRSDHVPIWCVSGDIVLVCRHGHFEGTATNAWTGMPHEMTGDKSLDALIWFPEGYVPQLWDRFWNGRG